MKPVVIFSVLLTMIFYFLPTQIKAQTADDYNKAAQKAFSKEKHKAALESIIKAIDLNPKELEYQYLLSLILIRQKKSKEAFDILYGLILADEAKFSKAYFDLAAIYSEQKKFKDAISVLRKAEKVDRNRALLEQGFTYLNAYKLNNAIEKFKEVKESPRFRQSACYHLAVAYYRKMEHRKALAYGGEALESASETGIARNAKLLIDKIKKEMKLTKPFLLMLSSTTQYDDNVILQPLEQVGLQKIGIPPSKQGDYVTLLTLKGAYKPFMKRNWDLTLETSYSQYLYAKLKTNDLTAIMPAARLNFSFFPVFFRFSYTFGRFIVDDKPYANVHSIFPVISLVEGRYARSELMFQTNIRRYLDGITPDANQYIIGYQQFLRVPKIGEAMVGYKYEIEDNKEDKGDFSSHEILFGIAAPFILKTYLSVRYSYLKRYFKFTEVISLTQTRLDNQHFFNILLTRRISKYFEVNLMFAHTTCDSNICNELIPEYYFNPYNWRKRVVSLSITAFF